MSAFFIWCNITEESKQYLTMLLFETHKPTQICDLEAVITLKWLATQFAVHGVSLATLSSRLKTFLFDADV